MSADVVILVAVFAALQLADGVSTHVLLARGHREANPVMAWLMDRIGVLPALLLAKGASIGVALWSASLYDAQHVLPALVFLCTFYVYVVYNNVRLLVRGGA